MNQTNPSTPTVNNQAASTDQSVDKIRDILFGAQVRSIDERIRQLEQSLMGNFNLQLANLKDQTEKNTAQVREQLNKHEAYTRTAQNEAINLINQNMAKQFEQTREQVRQQFANVDAKSRDDLTKIAQLVAQVEAASVPRTQLAQFLQTLSSQLTKPQ